MERRKFTVIPGGGGAHSEHRRFVSAYVTDTRLMGVVGLHICWEMTEEEDRSEFHQFFYFDAEEYGLDRYQSYQGSDELALMEIEGEMFGGLGGRNVTLTRREALFLLQDFCRDSVAMGVSLPEPKSEYQWMLDDPVQVDDALQASVKEKMCTRIRSDDELVHYFLMRSFGKDLKGRNYICDSEALAAGKIEDVSEPYGATLYRNAIEEFINADGTISYLSESLIEVDQKNQYRLVMTEVFTEGDFVVSAQRRSAFTVTAQEVAMLLSRSEFVTVFECLAHPEEAMEVLKNILPAAMAARYDNGCLFMQFYQNNEHVNRRIFQMNEDVQSIFYLTDFGQLILGAYTLPSIWEAEHRLQRSPLGELLIPVAKFEFKEPVLMDFVQSDYEDFEDFLNDIRGDQ